MSETWAIALLGIVFTAASAALCALIREISLLRIECRNSTQELSKQLVQLTLTLKSYVTVQSCQNAMNNHCTEIKNIEKKVESNTKLLERIVQYHKTIGSPID